MSASVLGGPVQRAQAPDVAAILTLVGGGFVLAGGLLLWVVGTVLAHVFGLSSPLFFGGVVLGVVTVLVGGLMWLVPAGRRVGGAIALACAVASLPLAFGGLVVGFVLTAIGGALAVARPSRGVVVMTTATPQGPAPPWT